MRIINLVKNIQEAAKRQNIVVTDILEDGIVVSDLPAVTKTYMFEGDEECEKCNGNGCDECGKLTLKNEEVKVEHGDRRSAAEDIVDSIIKGDYEKAHEALDEFIKLYTTDEIESDEDEESEEENSPESEAEENAEKSGTDEDYLMPASDDEDEEKRKDEEE